MRSYKTLKLYAVADYYAHASIVLRQHYLRLDWGIANFGFAWICVIDHIYRLLDNSPEVNRIASYILHTGFLIACLMLFALCRAALKSSYELWGSDSHTSKHETTCICKFGLFSFLFLFVTFLYILIRTKIVLTFFSHRLA